MKRYILMMAAVGTVLLLAGCGSAAPEHREQAVCCQWTCPLPLWKKQPDQYTADPDGNTRTTGAVSRSCYHEFRGEAGFALYPLLSETNFRRLMAQDGDGFYP